MINVIFPDGSKKQFNKDITGLEIASSISKSLAKVAMVVEVDGELTDLSMPISRDCNFRI